MSLLLNIEKKNTKNTPNTYNIQRLGDPRKRRRVDEHATQRRPQNLRMVFRSMPRRNPPIKASNAGEGRTKKIVKLCSGKERKR